MAVSFIPADTVEEALNQLNGSYFHDQRMILLKKYQHQLPLPFQFLFRLSPYGDKKLSPKEEKALYELPVWLEQNTKEDDLHAFAHELREVQKVAVAEKKGVIALGD